MYRVGQKVRVLLGDRFGVEEGSTCRALIACCNMEDEDLTYDVIYESNPYELVEDEAVDSIRISSLEDFECSSDSDAAPTALLAKERGNKLFQLKDYDAAREQYTKALHMASPRSPTIGSRVVVLNRLGEYVSGTASDMTDGGSAVDVIYDAEDENGVDEEDGVPLARVILLAVEAEDTKLQVMLFMNLAKVSLKLKRNGWAVRYSSCAMGIIKSDGALLEELNKKLIDAYYFRAKVFLIVNRPGRALTDAERIGQYGDAPKADLLKRQIAQHKQQRKREDRQLARDVAKWVESAMEINAAGGRAEDASIGDDR